MADVDSCTKQQHLLKEHHQANPSKYYTRFLYKAVLVLIFSVGIQVFPSQAPEFINQTLNRNWELLHLLFVGIAVSYGLFSRRNDETDKDIYNNQSMFDSVQSLMSRFLQVSSVFEDEAENLSGSDDSKAQTWCSLYYRNEPPVIVAKDHSVLDETITSCLGNPEKPLLLPVRSLKTKALNQTGRGNRANSSSLGRSNSSLSSKRFSSKGTNGGLDREAWVEKWSENNNVVLPSPIPWRSRSGRMEMKENEFGSKSNRLSRSNSMSCSPKLSHSPKKSSSPPPPPPPPMIRKPSSLEPVSSSTRDEASPWKFANGPNELKGTKGKSRKAGKLQTGRINGKTVRFDHQTSSLPQKLNRETVGFTRKPNPTFMELAQEEKKDTVEKVMVETTDDDSESEGDEPGETGIVWSMENNEQADPSSGNDAVSDVDKAPLPSYGYGRERRGPRYGSLIHGQNLTDVVITGNNGSINGQGQSWWKKYRQKLLNHTRGPLVQIMWSNDVVIANITLRDSPFWTFHPYDCKNVTVRNVTILAPVFEAPNTDGIDPDSCEDVVIEDCYISVGDDAIAIKSGWDQYGIAYGRPSRNILIRNLIVRSMVSAGISIGSEMSGGVSNVTVENILVWSSRRAVRIKTAVGRGGYVRDITYRNLTFNDARVGIVVKTDYNEHPDLDFDKNALPILENISFTGIHGEAVRVPVRIHGSEDIPVRNVTFRDMNVGITYKKKHVFQCAFVQGRVIGTIFPAPCENLDIYDENERLVKLSTAQNVTDIDYGI